MTMASYFLAIGFWALMITHDLFCIVTLGMFYMFFLWIRFHKPGLLCLWMGLIVLSMFLCYPRTQEVHPGIYRIYQIKQNYVLAKNKDTAIIVYGIKDPNFYDCYYVSQIEPIDHLKNIYQFSFSDYMAKQNIYYCGRSHAKQFISSSHSLKSQLYSRWKENKVIQANFYGIYQEETPSILTRLGLPIIGIFYIFQRRLQRYISKEKVQIILLILMIGYGYLFVFTISFVRFFLLSFYTSFLKKRDIALSASIITFLCFFPKHATDFVFVFPILYRLIPYTNKRKQYRAFLLAISQLIYFHELNIPLLLCFSWIRTIHSYIVLCSLLPLGQSLTNVWYDWIQKFPLSHFHYVPGLLFYLLVIGFVLYPEKRKIACIGLCILPWLQPYMDPFFHVYMIDIGQGDCTLILEPFHQSAIMIDCGQSFYRDNVKDIIVPVLKDLQVKRLDALIVTHSDFDHDGGVTELEKMIPIQQVIRSRYEKPKVKYPFFSLLPKRETSDTNDESIVSYFSYDDFHYLWMGDASVQVEQELIQQYKLSVDILKLGHHGSSTSSSMAFLDQTRPKVGLVSVGKKNNYGHPSSTVIANCHTLGIHLFETRKEGMIHLFSFKGILCIETASHLIGIVKTSIMKP
ncbi:MAG: MBL fold metallo-hydrolase [Absicoccus sp.]|uniref:ComEC/Rec2 family competence protein n=1 Tax=Absicoccus sp. TaxID=2718527 RepID=UPI002A75340B|nr:MBL fold metallo-hydrolase [Absicoccus sp.]MDY3035331.1 MBL fold metallo-hydrolase [Absicoccus sp.]